VAVFRNQYVWTLDHRIWTNLDLDLRRLLDALDHSKMLTHLAPTTKRINRIRVPVNPNPEAVCFNRPVLRPANFGLYHRPPTSSTPSPSGSSISAFGSHSPAFRTLGSFKSFLAQPNTSQSRQSFKPLYSRLGGGGRSDRPGSTANLGFRKPSSPSLWYYSSPKNAANPPRNAEHSSPDTGAGRRPSHNSQSQSHSHSQSESSHGAGARPQFGSEAHNQRNRWSSRDNTSRARLDSKAPISHTLANMCIWDVHCQVFSGSMVMINQVRFDYVYYIWSKWADPYFFPLLSYCLFFNLSFSLFLNHSIDSPMKPGEVTKLCYGLENKQRNWASVGTPFRNENSTRAREDRDGPYFGRLWSFSR
jgi:hypothetical protein